MKSLINIYKRYRGAGWDRLTAIRLTYYTKRFNVVTGKLQHCVKKFKSLINRAQEVSKNDN